MQLYIDTPPENPSVFISPPNDTTSDLECLYHYPNDIDGDTVAIEFEWYKNEVFYSDIAISISSLETQRVMFGPYRLLQRMVWPVVQWFHNRLSFKTLYLK